jgi:hypothetical protein
MPDVKEVVEEYGVEEYKGVEVQESTPSSPNI